MRRVLFVSIGLALALGGPAGRQSALAATAPSQRELAARPALKLIVTGTGWQQARQPALLAAGLDPATDPRELRLFADGIEQGVSVTGNGDGVFDSDESIEFYGVGRDTLWAAARTYWLIDGAGGKPIPGIANLAGGPAPTSFLTAAALRERTIYLAALKNGDATNFFGDQVTTTGVTKTVAVVHLDVSEAAALQVVLQGVTAGNHQVSIALNGQPVGHCWFDGQDLHTCAVSPVSVVEGPNQIQLVAQGAAPDVSVVASAEIDYGHLFVADADTLTLTAPPVTQLTIAGFSRPDVRVMDVTDPDSPVELVTGLSTTGSTYAVTVNTPGNTFPSTLYAFSSATVATPRIAQNHPSTWTEPRNGELVILSNGLFLDALAPLVTARRQQGWSVQLVDLQDVYDEFGAGDKSVFAVRDFLRAIHSRWTQPPRFVLLVGDASFDSRNFLGKGDFDFAPTKLIDTQQMETASDDWFVDWNDDGLPDIAIGRLPVRTPAEATTVVDKIVGYAGSADLPRGALFIAGRDEPGVPFEEDSAASAASVADLLPATNFYLDQPTSTEANLIPLLDRGPFLVNYFGHGSVSVWDELLNGVDAAALSNQSLSIYVNMNCLNGFFHDIYTESLAESLMKAPNGGAVAVWASSSLASFDQQATLNREFVSRLTRTSLGEAAGAAKRAITDVDARRTWILFGDPTLFGTPTRSAGGDGGSSDGAGGGPGGWWADGGPARDGAPVDDARTARDAGARADSQATGNGSGCDCRMSASSSGGIAAVWVLLLVLGGACRSPRRRPRFIV
ncbi:MAG: C25 family cysteine peptidase [Polyangia bacterium]